jgi:gluconolactonase
MISMGMDWEFESVAGPFGFTEGPVWDGRGVLFSDIANQRIMRYDVTSETTTEYRRGTGAANGLKLDDSGRLYGCEMGGRRVVRYTDTGHETVAAGYRGKRFNSPNDLAIADDWIWFTDPFYDTDWDVENNALELDHRSVYRVTRSGDSLVRVTDDTTNPNGILVSPTEETLYVAQHDFDGAQELRAYPIRDDRTVGDYEVLHDFGHHRGIDGMCLDADGNIVATAGWDESGPGPMLYVFGPSGRILERHDAPSSCPTNCCFGDEDLQSLYVTDRDGSLYRARTDRVGHLEAPETVTAANRSA